MTQIFDVNGNIVPVTLIETGPCTILEIKENPAKVKVGFASIKEKHVKKPLLSYYKKLAVSPLKVIREFKSTDNKDYKVGQELKVDVFKKGDAVDVTGTSIGKGFQGGMKRWNWAGGPDTHGSMHHRRVGSIGSSADPSRTLKGRNMPGHMGARRTTVQGLRIIDIDLDNNILTVKGAVPSHKNAVIMIRRSKKKAWKNLDEKKVVVIQKVNPMKQSKAKAGKKKA